MYNQEIEPIDKLEELCVLLKDQQIEIHKEPDSDPEYAYLDKDCVCITILNPYCDSKMFIDLEGEFTLTFEAFHSHFYADIDGYKELINTIKEILSNEICSASIYWGKGKKWLGSTSIHKGETNKSIKENFSFVFKKKEFKTKLNQYGGEVQYAFWNPSDNSSIQIPRKDNE